MGLSLNDDRGGFGSNVNREEEWSGRKGRAIGLGWGRRWRSAIEPLAEGVNGDLAEAAELDVSQSRAMEVGDDGRPVELTG